MTQHLLWLFSYLGSFVASIQLLAGGVAHAQEVPAESVTDDQHAAGEGPAPTYRLVVVTGAAGEPEYGKQFSRWAELWQRVAGDANWPLLRIGGDATSNDLEALKVEIESWRSTPDSSSMTYVLVLIGHGTAQKGEAKFNLRGPDLSANELAKWIAPVQSQVVVVNCGSASAPFINSLSGKGRVIVTATKSEQESNFCRFGEYLPKALLDPASDLDHDDQVSLAEAVISAANQTRDFYLAEDRIQTEHALLDDNGDTRGSPVEVLAAMMRGEEPQIKQGRDSLPKSWDGAEASRLVFPNLNRSLTLLAGEESTRREIESQLIRLRQGKKSIDEASYYEQLERLLVKLAELYEEVDKQQEKEAKSP